MSTFPKSKLLSSSADSPDFIPFALPDINSDEEEAVIEVLRSGWITTGHKAKEFENKFAEAVGAKFAVAVNSATAAMHLALEAIGLADDDEVIVPTYTFAATAEVVRYFGARPVLVDIDSDTFNISLSEIEKAVTPKTKAIIPVHIAGYPVKIEEINDLASRHGIHVIEDAAHAFPCEINNKKIGSISDFTCFSFYANKTITTAEGGMICTDNPEWADRCRIMSLHGISKDAWKRFSSQGSWKYNIIAPGFKYNLTDIAAALGIVQLDKAEQMRSRREYIASEYNKAFSSLDSVTLPYSDCKNVKHAWQLYMLRIVPEKLRLSRDQIIEELRKAGVGCSVHYIPLHCHKYYQDKYGFNDNNFPNAYAEYKKEISLPIYSSMKNSDIMSVIEKVQNILLSNAL